jgi:ribose 5-phosphate isomerase A
MSKAGKRNAALRALREELRDRIIFGVGTGSTVAYFIEELGSLVQRVHYHIRCVPSSLQTQKLCVKAGLNLVTLEEEPLLDVTVDGADEIDSKLNLIKGGGGALTREKILASASKRLAIIADESKLVKRLGETHPVPVEVLPFALGFVENRLKRLRPAKIAIRTIDGKNNARAVTDNGNYIIDLTFKRLENPSRMSALLNSIPGVIENGIFVEMTDVVYLGGHRGVRVLR